MVLLLSLSSGGGVWNMKFCVLKQNKTKKQLKKTKQNKNQKAEEKNNSKSLLPPRIVEN